MNKHDLYYAEMVRTRNQLRQDCPIKALKRLDRGFLIAANSHVILEDQNAVVRSQTHLDGTYQVSSLNCDCPDHNAPILDGVKHCKHQYAVWITRTAKDAVLAYEEELQHETWPAPSTDINTVAVWGYSNGAVFACINRNGNDRTYLDITLASRSRLSDLARHYMDTGPYRVRPFMTCAPGWVLEADPRPTARLARLFNAIQDWVDTDDEWCQSKGNEEGSTDRFIAAETQLQQEWIRYNNN